MELRIVKEKGSWNEFLFENGGSFIQSFEWGEFQKQFYRKVWRIKITHQERKVLEAQVIQKKFFPSLSFCYFYIPYGPVFGKDLPLDEKKAAFQLLLEELEEIGKIEDSLFLRIEPLTPLPLEEKFLSQREFGRCQPQKTLILNIENPEEKIFRDFRPKMRYNIRLAMRKGVQVLVINEKDELQKYFKIFYSLISQTAKRHNFRLHPKEHYENLLSIRSEDFQSILFLAQKKEKVIAANLVVFFNKVATYLHGGSSYEARGLMAPHLLHWKQITYAKRRGCKRYDFWGIDEKKWPGLTAFKRQFGGRELIYPLGADVIFQRSFYNIYKLAKKLKRIL